LVFASLVAIGALGRQPEVQPAWNFTPLAAAAMLGAYYFRSMLPATLLPVCILTVANLTLQAHDNMWVLASVYAMSMLPVALGRAARQAEGRGRILWFGIGGLAPATAFYIVTNFTVWATQSLHYPLTPAGLAECYVAGLPFYGTMLAGDVCYVSLMVACVAAAQMVERRTLAPVATKR
jgi:hypothetical protein